ncbi:MAG: RNA methyltransferase [Melioribacteraceae bacterium]|nr:RNA methyltransferase [Melioribacteraceae bacterium]
MTKNELKYYSLLLQKKHRREENKFLVEGIKLITEALNSNYVCEKVFYTNAFFENNLDKINFLKSFDISIEQITRKDIERLSDVKSPQEIVGVFQIKNNLHSKAISNFIVALENINDPGNFGTIIRNCDWFGVETIIASDDCAEIYSPKVIRASAGSVFHLNVIEENNFIDSLINYKNEGYKIYCSDINGKNLDKILFNDKKIISLSNEANGPSQTLLNLSDEIITIPKKGKAESLNVANASAIILYELTK